jgi:ankyrin repeat protein
MAELLLANNADVNAKNNKGETPFRVAVGKDKQDVIELLRQHGGHE